jgi:hypothetical protein
MIVRAFVAFALLAALAVPQAGAASLKEYPVPTGAFAIGLPAAWVGVTSASPGVLEQLEKLPTFKSFAQSNALKLIAADPTTQGRVYMDTGAERVGAISLAALAGATKSAIGRGLGKSATVTAKKVKLPAGPAYVIHVAATKKTGTNESDEYLILHDQVEYVIVYVAPSTSWSKYAPTFARSVSMFRFLSGPNLNGIVLSGAQIGKGYRLAPYPNGSSFIGETTLDLCAGTYPSENLRTGRLQVSYKHPARNVDISNEVVTYADGGAQQALSEVTKVARSCAARTVTARRGPITTTFRATAMRDPKLPAGAVAVKLVIKATDGKKHLTQTGIAIYQVKGNTLSGVYTFVAKGTTFADAERVAFHAAEQSAQNLGGARPKKSSNGSKFTA